MPPQRTIDIPREPSPLWGVGLLSGCMGVIDEADPGATAGGGSAGGLVRARPEGVPVGTLVVTGGGANGGGSAGGGGATDMTPPFPVVDVTVGNGGIRMSSIDSG